MSLFSQNHHHRIAGSPSPDLFIAITRYSSSSFSGWSNKARQRKSLSDNLKTMRLFCKEKNFIYWALIVVIIGSPMVCYSVGFLNCPASCGKGLN